MNGFLLIAAPLIENYKVTYKVYSICNNQNAINQKVLLSSIIHKARVACVNWKCIESILVKALIRGQAEHVDLKEITQLLTSF